MKTIIYTFLLLLIMGCENKEEITSKNELNNMLNTLAEKYVRLALNIGTIDPNFVDAYYGAEEFLPTKSIKNLSRDSLINYAESECNSLLDKLDSLSNYSATKIEQMRFTFLYRQLLSVKARLFMLKGGEFTFREEAEALYDISIPKYDESDYQKILDDLASLLGGKEDLSEKIETLENKFKVPLEKVEKIFSLCIEECRKRTQKHILLPPNENFSVEIVKDKPWSAYNWYKGSYKSLIQVNLSIVPTVDRLLGLAAHEGYPGHHVYNSLLEKHLVKNRGWIEFSIYPLFSQQSFIAEGTADFGIELIFPNDSHTAFIKNVLCKEAGIDTNDIDRFLQMQKLKSQLDEYIVAIAEKYLDGLFTKEKSIDYLMKFTQSSKARAEQRISFFDTYRSYIVNYSLGRKLVESYINSFPNKTEIKWEKFEEILNLPATVSFLRSRDGI